MQRIRKKKPFDVRAQDINVRGRDLIVRGHDINARGQPCSHIRHEDRGDAQLHIMFTRRRSVWRSFGVYHTVFTVPHVHMYVVCMCMRVHYQAKGVWTLVYYQLASYVQSQTMVVF